MEASFLFKTTNRLARCCYRSLSSVPSSSPGTPATLTVAVNEEKQNQKSDDGSKRKKPKRKGNNEAASKVVYQMSPSLSNVVEISQTTRSDALKRLWNYIKANNLQNQLERNEIVCDDKLKSLFGRDKVSIPQLLKFMNPHISKI